jgi:hypothetical protein
VLVRKEFGSRHDCLGEQSLINVDRSGAQGGVLSLYAWMGGWMYVYTIE